MALSAAERRRAPGGGLLHGRAVELSKNSGMSPAVRTAPGSTRVRRAARAQAQPESGEQIHRRANSSGSGIFAGLVLTRERNWLRSPWFWAGGAIAFLIFLPNLVWNIQHQFPFLELQANIRRDGRDVALSP